MTRATKRFYTVSGMVIVLMLATFGPSDSHGISIPYMIWKTGLTPSQYRIGLRFLGADDGFRRSLNGRTLTDLHSLFPVLVPPSAGNPYQRKYSLLERMSDRDYRWIGDSGWLIQFRGGRVVEMDVYKG